MSSCSKNLWWCWPWWFYLYNPFLRFKMWYVLTSSKYTWTHKTDSRKWMRYAGWDPVSHWNHHTDWLTFPSLSPGLSYDQQCYHWSLVNWIVLRALTHPVLLVNAPRLLVQLRNGYWVIDLCPTPTAFSVTQTEVRKSRKHILGQKSPHPTLNLVVEKL